MSADWCHDCEKLGSNAASAYKTSGTMAKRIPLLTSASYMLKKMPVKEIYKEDAHLSCWRYQGVLRRRARVAPALLRSSSVSNSGTTR